MNPGILHYKCPKTRFHGGSWFLLTRHANAADDMSMNSILECSIFILIWNQLFSFFKLSLSLLLVFQFFPFFHARCAHTHFGNSIQECLIICIWNIPIEYRIFQMSMILTSPQVSFHTHLEYSILI